MRFIFVRFFVVCVVLIFGAVFLSAEQGENIESGIEMQGLMETQEDAEQDFTEKPETRITAESLTGPAADTSERKILGPYEFAVSRADSDQAPVMAHDPGTESAVGYIIWEDLDGDGSKEAVIPYIVRLPENYEKERAPKQVLTVDIIKGDEKIRGFIEAEIEYIRRPKVYLTVRSPFEGELPKVFLQINDGFGNGRDRKFLLVFNGFDPKDEDREKRYATVKMPWEFILKQFAADPMLITFETEIKKESGKFYINIVDEYENWPRIPMKNINDFKKELSEYRENISWMYAYE